MDVSGLLPHFERNFKVIHEMIDAVQCIKAQGIKTALLTNNWKHDQGEQIKKSLLPIDPDIFNVVSYLECVLEIFPCVYFPYFADDSPNSVAYHVAV